MTLALRYTVQSDVGLLREGNEDAAYAGPHLLAIADGMGGHAAGEVASAVAISTLAPLDADTTGIDMLQVLADAIADANAELHQITLDDPATEGMGTTLTALLWSGEEFALCHIGDSRAYLLRDGEFHRITHDHTLVQSLVDEGRLTPRPPPRTRSARWSCARCRAACPPSPTSRCSRQTRATGTCSARTACPTW